MTTKKTALEIETLIGKIVVAIGEVCENDKGFCFDVKFTVNDIPYRLTFAEEKTNYPYLKDN